MRGKIPEGASGCDANAGAGVGVPSATDILGSETVNHTHTHTHTHKSVAATHEHMIQNLLSLMMMSVLFPELSGHSCSAV